MTVFMRELETNNVIKYRNIDRVMISHHTIYTMWLLVRGEKRETFCSDEYSLEEVSDLAIYKEESND